MKCAGVARCLAEMLTAARANIRLARARGESPAKIAKALGVSRASIYRHLAAESEKGQAWRVRMHVLQALAHARRGSIGCAADRGQRLPLAVRETAVPELFGTPASQHLFQTVAACRKSGSGPAWAGVCELFDLQHGETP